ncbi:MAG: hypothetical protein FJX46_00005, partial [Alphaproteobacteria bacterium]|nr:hypothetical protein [Alphaproteobacteria bacterium]
MTRPRYRILWQGDMPLERIGWEDRPEAGVAYSPSQLRDIESWWRRQGKTGVALEDLPLYRVLAVARRGKAVSLRLGRTSYKLYQGTNVAKPAWALAAPRRWMGNPLSLSAVLVTSDGHVPMNFRSRRV